MVYEQLSRLDFLVDGRGVREVNQPVDLKNMPAQATGQVGLTYALLSQIPARRQKIRVE